MTDNHLPSLERLIRAKIQRRIIAAMALLFAGAIIVTVLETALSYSDLVARLDRRADTLQDLIISEVLVNNQEATDHILADANRATPDQSVRWITPADFKGKAVTPGIGWQFPGTWAFSRPLKRLGDQDFGIFIFSGNFFTSGGLLNTLTHRLAFTVAICVLMAILLFPIASKTPKDLILEPVQYLLALIRDDSDKKLPPPAFAEIKSIQDDFVLLMSDRRKLESQRLETAQLRTVTRTAQMLAHDIRRPFSLLKATLDGLTQTNTPGAIQELISETVPGVKKSLEHLDGVIGELTNVGSSTPAEKAVFTISDAIIGGVATTAPHEESSGRLVLKLHSSAKILGVQNQIERVIANILSNALQAMGSDDRIEIVAFEESDGTAVVTITNTGSYIPPEDRENIFKLFFTTGKPDGTGLGLAICRHIIDDHNGSITVQSNSDEGTRFTILLPIYANGSNPDLLIT
ncbi:MAG: ATP-binding protein [Oligoflexales bacterium]